MGTKTFKLSFAFGLMLLFATSHAQNKLPTGTAVDQTNHQQVKKDENARFVYSNYKGISDITLAKKEWIKDHPNEYAKLKQANYKPSTPASSTTSAKPLLNADRRLPMNYDDSKTNNSSK